MAQSASRQTVRVWDIFIRIFHWTLVVAFAVAYLTEGRPAWLHLTAGFTIAGLVALRIVWGFVGPEHARFSDFVTRPAAIFGYLRGLVTGSAKRYLGHSPAGGAMVVALILSLAATTGTGMVTYFTRPAEAAATTLAAPSDAAVVPGEKIRKPPRPIKEAHELLANFTLFLIVLHLGGVALASFAHRENLPRSMLTGEKRI
ncbi:MAG TPA: cytochrome b/b6 domain-containing protein [Parvibaculum sp.]